MYSLRNRRAPRNLKMKPSPVLNKIRGLKKGLMVSGIKRVVFSGKDHIRITLESVKGLKVSSVHVSYV